MSPRNLARIAYDAVDRGWNFTIHCPELSNPRTDAEFRRGKSLVVLAWDMDGVLSWSTVNGTDTPYQQCTRLISSPEGA